MKNSSKIIVLIISFLITSCSFVKAPDPIQKIEKEINIFDAVMKQDNHLITEIVNSDKNIDINAYDSQGYTPLMLLVRLDNVVMAEIFIKNHNAKIYQPHKENESLTSFSMVGGNSKEMIRVFKSESLRYAKLVETLVQNGSYGEVLKLSRENYLPITLIMPTSKKTPLALMASLYNTQSIPKEDVDSIGYIRYILESVDQHPGYLLKNEDHFQNLKGAIGSESLFQDIRSTYLKMDQN